MIKLRVGEHNGGIASHMIDGSKRSLAGGPEIVYAARAFGFLRDTACKTVDKVVLVLYVPAVCSDAGGSLCCSPTRSRTSRKDQCKFLKNHFPATCARKSLVWVFFVCLCFVICFFCVCCFL